MARRSRNYGGFGDGFAQGFGLVQDFYETQDRKNIAQQELEMNREYREGLIEDRKQQRILDAEQREIDRQQNDALNEIRKTQADTASINAKTAETKANTAKLEQEGRLNPDGTERISAVDQATIDTRKAQREVAEKQKAALDYDAEKSRVEQLNINNGRIVSELYQLAQAGDAASLEQMENIFIENQESLFDPRSTINLRDVLNPDSEKYALAVNDLMEQLASGSYEGERLSPEALAAVGDTFGANRAQYMWKTINPTDFPNAPDYMDGGTVIESNIIDIQQTKDANGNLVFTLTAANEVRMPNGDTYMYFPQITPGRKTAQGQPPTQIPMQDGMQALYARRLMANYIQSDPIFRQKAEKVIKERNFGSIEKFNSAVESETSAINELLENSDSTSDAGSVLGDEFDIDAGGKTVGQILSDRNFVENEVRKKLLYGSSKISYVKRAQNLGDELREAVPNYDIRPYGSVGGASSRTPNVASLIKEDKTLSLNHLAHIDGFFVQDGTKATVLRGKNRDERRLELEKLKEYLKKNGLLKQ